ncbi:MAG: efflux transporter outer membrane subunit [Gammaproteobacteria bacterium]|nr:efflux transporter outer membrane subunit [Gammaproteobacteria bacterium]MDE0413331.1 efflux transporter outer membrane subunit [Gammaproteobacteria bacterium]
MQKMAWEFASLNGKSRITAIVRPFAPLLATIALAGCSTVSMPALDADTPPDWGAAATGEWPGEEWWDAFGSGELRDLMQQVQERNLSLESAERSLRQAQLALIDAGFDLYPSPVVNFNASGRYSGSAPPGGAFQDDASDFGSLALSLHYADILSKPYRFEAAEAAYESAAAQLAATRLNLLGTAASTYFRILHTRDRIEAARLNLQNAEAIERITRARVEAGVLTPIDALQQQIAVQRQRNALAQYRQEEYTARAALALLVAEPVRNFDVQATTLDGLLTPSVAPGLPSELLIRRPDIVQAEMNLRRARANVAIARNALLPVMSLTASANTASSDLRKLTSDNSVAASLSASLVQNVFDFGRRGRARESARLAMDSSLASYREIVIRAFNDIEIALGNIELLDSLSRIALEDLRRAEESLRIAEVRYREGVIDYQRVLTAQDFLYSARDNVLSNKRAHLNAIVSLYQSLGGGWTKDGG